jgi:hypothetical protein
LQGWPPDQRIIARRVPRPGGQQAKLGEDPNWRYGAFTTNTAAGQLQWLDARHRTQAHIEDKMKEVKACGAENLPSIILSREVDHGSEQGGCIVDGVLDVAAVGSESSGGMLPGEWVPGRVVAGDLVDAPVAEGSRQRVA